MFFQQKTRQLLALQADVAKVFTQLRGVGRVLAHFLRQFRVAGQALEHLIRNELAVASIHVEYLP
ncbi:hypothetical protein D3C86_1889990 [compost metagenome]